MRLAHRQVVDVASTTIIATENGANEFSAVTCDFVSDEGETGIVSQKGRDAFPRVRITEANALAVLLQGESLVVVPNGHFLHNEALCDLLVHSVPPWRGLS